MSSARPSASPLAEAEAARTLEAALVQQFAATRQPAVFGQLMGLAPRRVGSAVYKIVLCPHTTNDLVQEAFVRAYQQFDRYDGRAAFSSWVCRIGINLALSHLRRQRVRATTELDERELAAAPRHEPDRQLMTSEKRELVDRAMALLPPALRAALVLAVIEEMPIPEVADTLGCTRANVYWRVFRARRLLQARLHEWEEGS